MTLQADQERSLNFAPYPAVIVVPSVGNSYGFMSSPRRVRSSKGKTLVNSPEQYTEHPQRDRFHLRKEIRIIRFIMFRLRELKTKFLPVIFGYRYSSFTCNSSKENGYFMITAERFARSLENSCCQ